MQIREAREEDASAIAVLITQLGYETTEQETTMKDASNVSSG